MTPKEELKAVFSHRNPIEIACIISGFTAHRTTMIDELTEKEVQDLLNIYQLKQVEKKKDLQQDEKTCKSLRSKILAIAEKEGLKEPNSWEKFNDWMLHSSTLKKSLNKYNLPELKQLLKQMHALKTNNRKSAAKPMTAAWWKKGVENINLN
ncbi:hypothetical protein [Elizabethkingia anophelis]|uniref:hypothetical protein n=1 Tax=Elizabethkingia anophelis TaxID=1117645 RepID=UPI0002437A9F|nr:hypothetical protein [Elizabethkingia anophelis]MCQ0429367.1 hypothetical protein [Elizabethkingia anophelis]